MYVFRDLKKLKELEKLGYKDTLGGYTKLLRNDDTFAFIEILKDASIKKYREENGPFEALEDLMKVSGIGRATYERIRDYLTLK